MKKQMISFKQDDFKFNFRVAGIIYSKDKSKILVSACPGIDFYILPGGRVEMFEESKISIKREINEELGIDVKVNLKIVLESFFELDRIKYHEIAHFYEITDHELDETNSEFYGTEEKDHFRWVNLSELESIDFRPKQLTKSLIEKESSLKHLVFNEL